MLEVCSIVLVTCNNECAIDVVYVFCVFKSINSGHRICICIDSVRRGLLTIMKVFFDKSCPHCKY